MTRERLPESGLIDAGEGPVVLLLQGTAPGSSAHANFAGLIPALQGYRVLAPDLLGFGAGPKDPELRFGPELWVRQAWQLLDDLEVERAFVVGNAMGARIALQLGLDQPQRIAGLALLSTRVTPTRSRAQDLLRDYRPGREAMAELIRECFVTDPELVTDELVESRYLASAAPGAAEAIRVAFREIAAAGPGPVAQDLSPITAPVLLLHGRHDRIVPAGDGALLAERIPQADLHVLAGTGHWLQVERATTVNLLIREVISRSTRRKEPS